MCKLEMSILALLWVLGLFYLQKNFKHKGLGTATEFLLKEKAMKLGGGRGQGSVSSSSILSAPMLDQAALW